MYCSLGGVYAQCPPDVTRILIFNDLSINLPLTTPFCLACRFVNTNTVGNFQFSDGEWTNINEGGMLTNGNFNGNVTLTNTDNTMDITFIYP